MSSIKNQTLAQLNSIEFSQYDELVFISKSIGTVISAQLAIDLSLSVSRIFLTPIEDTLQYINHLNNVKLVVFGSLDRYVHSSLLKAKCEKENINYLQIDGVGHRLKNSEIW